MVSGMNYTEALQYINEIPWTMRKPGLDRIKKLLDKLGRPDRKLKYVHVAGTNGKGSVCAMLASVFIEAGFNTGLFTSPHLMKYNERMKVNGTDITDRELAKCITKVAKAADEMKEEAASINVDYESPSEFEILTAAGLLWFKEKKCDIVVLEVGLGGEFDSTNVIENKELAIITPLGYEHTAILGNTIEEIATAKAGIISEGSHVVLAARKMKDNGKDAVKIEKTVAKICKEKNAEAIMCVKNLVKKWKNADMLGKTDYLLNPKVVKLFCKDFEVEKINYDKTATLCNTITPSGLIVTWMK